MGLKHIYKVFFVNACTKCGHHLNWSFEKSDKCPACGTVYDPSYRTGSIVPLLFVSWFLLLFFLAFASEHIILSAPFALFSFASYIAIRDMEKKQVVCFVFFFVLICNAICSHAVLMTTSVLLSYLVCMFGIVAKDISESALKIPRLYDLNEQIYILTSEVIPDFVALSATCAIIVGGFPYGVFELHSPGRMSLEPFVYMCSFGVVGLFIYAYVAPILVKPTEMTKTIISVILAWIASLKVCCFENGFLGVVLIVFSSVYSFFFVFNFISRSFSNAAIGPVANILAMMLKYNGGLTEKSRDISISLFVELGFSRKNIRAALEETEKHLANPNLNITSHINSAKTKLTTNNKIALVEALFKISSQNGIYRAEMELLDQIMNSFKISAKKRAELIKKHQKYFVGFQWEEAGTEEKKEQKREQKRHKRAASENGLLQNVSEAFALLGLKPGTDFYEVKRTYRRLAMKNHPDKFANAPEAERHAANIRMKELNKAFATIEKHAKR